MKKPLRHPKQSSFVKLGLLLKHRRELGHQHSFDCEICGKRSRRKDNLNRHMSIHEDKSLFQCNECGKLFSRRDNLQLHMELYHSQIGRSLKRKNDDVNETPVKRHLTKRDTLNEFYNIRVVSEKNIPKLRTKSTNHKMTLNELEVSDLPKILKTLKLLFNSLIMDLTEFMNSDDQVRMAVKCPTLDFPIIIPFINVAQLSSEKMLREIERVLQSYEKFTLDSSNDNEITYVDIPSGTGKKCISLDLDRFFVREAMHY